MIPVVYPQDLNWFYSAQAQNIVDDLRPHGIEASAIPVSDLLEQPVSSTSILILSLAETLTQIDAQNVTKLIKPRILAHPHRILVNYDCINTTWFERQFELGTEIFTDIFDISMIRQVEGDHIMGARYHWVPEAFTSAQLSERKPWTASRPIPWALIGHDSKERAAFVTAAVQMLPRDGFVYAPKLRPFHSGSGLGETSIARILEKTLFYIWGSHHQHRYHEGFRSLHAVANGAIPVKIDPIHFMSLDLPWVYPSLAAFLASETFADPEAAFRAASDYVEANGTIGANVARALADVESAEERPHHAL